MTQAPPLPEKTDAPPRPADEAAPAADLDWESLRDQVLGALDEDPANETRLVAHLDRAPGAPMRPSQRVVAALTGFCPGRAEAESLLGEALVLRQQRIAAGDGPAPLRLALLETLLRHNRRSPEPLLVGLGVSVAPEPGGIADPARAATPGPALIGEVQTELRRARRFRQPSSVLRLHLDAWEEVVERVGRATAERLLGEAVLLINNEIRDVDWSARAMDDDLVVFLSGTGRLGAWLVARRIAVKLGHVALPLPGGGPLRASIGIAAFPDDARFGPELLRAAERAVYSARAAGGGAVSDPGAPGRWRLTSVHPRQVRVVVRTEPEMTMPLADEEEGLVFDSPVAYEVGAPVELDCIEVSGTGRATVSGHVVRLEQRREGGYAVGVACRLGEATQALVRGAGRQGR